MPRPRQSGRDSPSRAAGSRCLVPKETCFPCSRGVTRRMAGPTLRFTSRATRAMSCAWTGGTRHPSPGKLPGLVARLAGILHAVEGATLGEVTPMVSALLVAAAVRIGWYAADHALAAFGMMGADPVLAGARVLLEWIRRKRLPNFSKRQ